MKAGQAIVSASFIHSVVTKALHTGEMQGCLGSPCIPMSSLHCSQCCPVLAPGDLKLLGKRKPVISVGVYELWEAGVDVFS